MNKAQCITKLESLFENIDNSKIIELLSNYHDANELTNFVEFVQDELS